MEHAAPLLQRQPNSIELPELIEQFERDESLENEDVVIDLSA